MAQGEGTSLPPIAILTEEQLATIVRREVRAVLEELRQAMAAPPGDLDTAQAAVRARVSRDTILDWIKTKGLAAHRAPGTRAHLIRPADLEAFLASPSARRPPPKGGPVDLAARAREAHARLLRRTSR